MGHRRFPRRRGVYASVGPALGRAGHDAENQRVAGGVESREPGGAEDLRRRAVPGCRPDHAGPGGSSVEVEAGVEAQIRTAQAKSRSH